jgi:hypothetical protein
MAFIMSKLTKVEYSSITHPVSVVRHGVVMVLTNHTNLQPNDNYVKNSCLLQLIPINFTSF